MTGERGQPGSSRFPGLRYLPVQLVLVDAQILCDVTRRFLVFPGQRCCLGFKFLGVHPPYFVLFSRLLLLICYNSRLSLCLPDGVRSKIRPGTMTEHDLALSRDMLLTSPVLKPGDIIINDHRGKAL
jgi:hypothetical protein